MPGPDVLGHRNLFDLSVIYARGFRLYRFLYCSPSPILFPQPLLPRSPVSTPFP